MTIVTADILEWGGVETYDCIHDDRLAMLLPSNRWSELAEQYRRLLRPGGICMLETINLGGAAGSNSSAARTDFEAAFKSAGFSEYREDRSLAAETGNPMILFVHGSG